MKERFLLILKMICITLLINIFFYFLFYCNYQGLTGLKGEQGLQGHQGPIGPIGDKGISGTTVFGPPGEDGHPGDYYNFLLRL